MSLSEENRHTIVSREIENAQVNYEQADDVEYVRLVSLISGVWEKAHVKAALAVNTELIEANWQTGRYIVEYEQHGNVKADYGKQLLTNLSRDLTRLRGKGYSRSNLFNMRLFYIRFPKIQTVSGQLTWSHYLELLKCVLYKVSTTSSLRHDTSFTCPIEKNCNPS